MTAGPLCTLQLTGARLRAVRSWHRSLLASKHSIMLYVPAGLLHAHDYVVFV